MKIDGFRDCINTAEPVAAVRMEHLASLPYTHVEPSGPEDGPSVLLLHGWGSSAQLMRPIAAALADSFRVLNVDLPGHGHSANPPAPWGVPDYAALVAHLIEQHLAPPVAIIGHSNGGRIALFMASDDRYARLIHRLVLISPSGVTPHRGLKYRLRRLTASALKAPFQVLPRPLRELGLDWLRHSLVWRMLGSTDYRTLDGVMRDTFVRTVNFFLEDRLHLVAAPTLIFWGDRDTAISRRQIEVLEAGIPDAGVVVLQGAGHYGYLDDPDTVIGAARHFLEVAVDDSPSPVESDRA